MRVAAIVAGLVVLVVIGYLLVGLVKWLNQDQP